MGFKKTSEMLTIGTSLSQSGTNVFTQKVVELPLNALDQEIFVVTAVKLDFGDYQEDVAGGGNSSLLCSVTSTEQTAVQGIANAQCIAAASRRVSIIANTLSPTGIAGVVGWEDNSMDTPPSSLDYIAIIATPNFYCQIDSNSLGAASSFNVRLYGYRARADSSTYAALVQNELLSA